MNVKIGAKVKMCEWKIDGDFASLCEKWRDDTYLSSDLAGIGELGRVDVRQHHQNRWKIVHQVRDPERCDRLMVLTTIDRHLHNPIGVREEIISTIHVVRFDFIHQSNNET